MYNFKNMKKTIRKEVLRKRDALSPDVRTIKDRLVKERLFSLPEYAEAKTILFYASFRSEVETFGLIEESIKTGKMAILPKVDKERHMLMLYEIKDVNELTNGYMGIPEPCPDDDRLVDIDHVDLVIVPGAAFDTSGNRLGYGAGYYDILLSKRKKKTPVIALAYEDQIVYTIPAEEHDIKMDFIVTEERVIRIP